MRNRDLNQAMVRINIPFDRPATWYPGALRHSRTLQHPRQGTMHGRRDWHAGNAHKHRSDRCATTPTDSGPSVPHCVANTAGKYNPGVLERALLRGPQKIDMCGLPNPGGHCRRRCPRERMAPECQGMTEPDSGTTPSTQVPGLQGPMSTTVFWALGDPFPCWPSYARLRAILPHCVPRR